MSDFLYAVKTFVKESSMVIAIGYYSTPNGYHGDVLIMIVTHWWGCWGMCPVPKSYSHPGTLDLSLGLLLLHFYHFNVERMDRRLTISAFCKYCSVILAHFFYSCLPLLHVRSTEHNSVLLFISPFCITHSPHGCQAGISISRSASVGCLILL